MSTPRRRATPTSTEVAKLAGVSRTTVSFVLNDVRTMGISEETRQKVLDAVRELNYQPHAAARILAGGSTGTIAVVIPNSNHLHLDAYLPHVLSTVNDRCHRYGYKVLLEVAEYRGKKGNAFINLIQSKRIDGLIVVNLRSSEYAEVQELCEQGFPVVVPGNGVEPFFVRRGRFDGLLTSCQIGQHLIDLGHHQIAHIAFAAEEYEAVVQRRRGLERILLEHGSNLAPELVDYADISARSGYEAMQRILARQHPFTALFAGNDTIAFGAMRALVEAGKRIPQDVAVVGYDDIPLAPFACPPLTTMRIDPASQGREAVDMLAALMNGQPYPQSELPYDYSLIIRDSCGASARDPARRTIGA